MGIPGRCKLLYAPWQTLSMPFALTPISFLHRLRLQIWGMITSRIGLVNISGRNWFCCRFRVFCLLSVKVCSWYKTHSKTGNLAGVRYVSILSVPGIQFRPVTVSCELEAFSGHKTLMYTLKLLNNLTRDRGSDCNGITNGRVELLVECILLGRCLLSKILFFIPVVADIKSINNLGSYWSNIETTWGDAHRDTNCKYQLHCSSQFNFKKTNLFFIK